MKILEIKKFNEVFEIHHSVNGYFLVMGTIGNTTELNITSKEVQQIKSAFTKSKLNKKK